ncbi:hypothetical protein DSM104299_03219 [Baekduia alba]|uniref:hypothetical protein n=1 Tax=Baekduia alba TaxID=2997333 RepID=UPI00233F7F38|nr:hypothetical protein [Baekduia alba]WCB94482.1 hypothetical protein DSM104299_03219 [Baekduia alba]
MTRRDRERKAAQRCAHAERRDHRQPDHPFTADQRRNARRDEWRKVLAAVRKAAA